MAEGDKFERRLRGFGWRKVYQLGKSGAAMSLVVDATVTAVSCGLRNELKCTRLADILGLLEFSLQADWQRQQVGKSDPNEPSPQSCLSVELERIQADELYSISVQLASTAAESVFVDISRCRNYPTREAIRDAFADVFVWRVVDNRCLSPVREGLALGNEHTAIQHERWERDFRTLLKPKQKD